MTLRLAGANPASIRYQEDLQVTRTNYFMGRDPSQWRTDIPSYGRVRYGSVYPGIDLVYYGNQRQLEHDFIVAPGANPSAIQLSIEGVQRPRIDKASGDLILDTPAGQLRLLKPVTYQKKDGSRVDIQSSYRLVAGNRLSFSVGGYDDSLPLTIDPILVYATYLGGSSALGDQGNGIAVDGAGNAYVVGTAHSTDFPHTSGAYESTNISLTSNKGTVFISKINPTGTALLYSTFLGGSKGDIGSAIALDSSGNAYLTGTTQSSDFPIISGAYSTVFANVFVTKLNSTGSVLIYSTFLGDGTGNAIAVNSAGEAFITGATGSATFPVTAGAFQTVNHSIAASGTNAFVTRLSADGGSLAYSTLLGGSEASYYLGNIGDGGNAIAVDSAGEAYVAGIATSTDFPVTAGAYQRTNPGAAAGGSNAFVTRLNNAGSALVFSTFLGGDETSTQSANAVALDSAGSVYIAGTAQTHDFPTTAGVLEPANFAAFVSKFNSTGSSLLYSTYLGNYLTQAFGLAVDGAGSAYIVGSTTMPTFPTTVDASIPFTPIANGLDISYSTHQGFLAKLSPDASTLFYSTYLGNPDNTVGVPSNGSAMALGVNGNAYVTGSTSTINFPITAGALQSVNKGINAFVAGFNLQGETQPHRWDSISFSASEQSIQANQPVTLTAKVVALSGSSTPTGTVTFYGLGAANGLNGIGGDCCTYGFASVALDGSGVASWTTSSLLPNAYSFWAYYSGDASNLSIDTYATGSENSVQLVVAGPPASISIVGNGSEGIVPYGSSFPYPLTVQVVDAHNLQIPGVTVNFTGNGLGFNPPSPVTNDLGQVSVTPIALSSGTLIATASVVGLSPKVTFPPLTATPVALTITLKNASREYGTINPTLSYVIAGEVSGDTITVTPSSAATLSSPVGTYPITASITGPHISGYTVIVVPAILTVSKAPLYISADNVAITYGQSPSPLTGYKLIGFVNGETASVVSGAPVLTSNVGATTPVGAYRISVEAGTLAAQNYYFNDTASGEGNVFVDRAVLTISPASYTIHAGDSLPAFTYSLSGFVNGETQATATTGAPVLYTTAPSPPTKGRYYIIANIGTLTAQNYSFEEYVSNYGILTVLP